MRFTRALAIAGMATVCGAGVALAGHVSQVDPATVPTGFLAAHNQVENIRISSLARAAERGEADVFIQHARLGANEATGWHTHPGGVFVEVVGGSLTYEDASRGKCRRVTYVAGEGFFDPGFGHVHRAIAGPSGADFYPVYVLPRFPDPPDPGKRAERSARPDALATISRTPPGARSSLSGCVIQLRIELV